LSWTKIGRYIYAVGGNEASAVASGIKVHKVKIFVYTFSGVMSALVGLVLTARLNSASSVLGSGYELDAIAASVIGGTSMDGGKGHIFGTLIGALIIGTISNGLDILNVSSYWQQIIKGMIILGAVLLDRRKEAA
jgi:ribose/xylose/arabinose/galactoside ABC-type transport system permease subunit